MGSERLLLVTGGSRGIGAATALKAGTRDYFVCVNYRRSFEAAASVVDGIRERGGDGIPVHADVGREKDVTRLFDAIDALPGNLVGVVNNAGELAPAARLENMDYDRWKSILTTNLFGTMCCTREGIRRMSRRFGGVGGAIVNVSSAASRTGAPNEYVDYASCLCYPVDAWLAWSLEPSFPSGGSLVPAPPAFFCAISRRTGSLRLARFTI